MKLTGLIIRTIFQIAVIILVPFAVMMGSARVFGTPLYLQIEYRVPGFPLDPYGFTLQDRLKWSTLTMDYLFSNSGISFLSAQKLADGTPLYNERELSHLVDVKRVVQFLLRDWIIALILLLVIGLLSWRLKWWPAIRNAISIGGWVTIGLIGLILVFVVTSFYSFFTDFHELFFSANTWVFLYSDTLIRLFPLTFWEELFIYIGVLSAVVGFLLGWLLRPGKYKNPH
jgi:integral membrane protein (TIGR01906 family)